MRVKKIFLGIMIICLVAACAEASELENLKSLLIASGGLSPSSAHSYTCSSFKEDYDTKISDSYSFNIDVDTPKDLRDALVARNMLQDFRKRLHDLNGLWVQMVGLGDAGGPGLDILHMYPESRQFLSEILKTVPQTLDGVGLDIILKNAWIGLTPKQKRGLVELVSYSTQSKVHKGDLVRKGSVIAVTANNGFHCTPQLHFNIFQGQEHIPENGSPKTIPVLFDGLPDLGMAHEGYQGTVP